MGRIRENISQNIAKHRKKQALSQKELADFLRTKPSTVSSWEQNVSSPNAEMLVEMCRLFRISVDEIYGIEETDYDFQFLKVCEWIEEAGFEIYQDETDKERDEYQICHPERGTIRTVDKQGLIGLIDYIVKMSDDAKEKYIIDGIRLAFLQPNEFINSKNINEEISSNNLK